jgi:alginate O-acetyltransferase complex protein AlgI
MLFNSLHFLLFFIVVTALYFNLGWQGRWRLLLLASCYFYMAFRPVYILILGFTIVIDYIAGIWIEKSEGKRRKWLLIISLISNIGVLAIFKYYDFFVDNLNFVLLQSELIPEPFPMLGTLVPGIILPIGLSFHTFQAMSYTIEVYRGHQPAERHFGLYALYVMFYPQLVAGPIERPQNVLPQFHQFHPFNWEEVKAGLMQMGWGLFKKVVIADRLALMVDHAYGTPQDQSGATLWVATFFYTFQIYCDFSGYSDMAIGAARVMGFKLMTNFRSPYLSKSISEFWGRWHISLSTWFRDYLYIPLGGNRVSEGRVYANLMIVFMVSGLWHGASWNFIVWGTLHGLYLVLAKARDSYLPVLKLRPTPWVNVLHVVVTFLLVMIAWVFFRATTLSDALYIINALAALPDSLQVASPLSQAELIFSFGLILFLLLKEKYQPAIQPTSTGRFYFLVGGMAALIYVFGIFNSNQFIYFQF